MWLLESDGDIFAGKTRWLKPGTKWLFGRTSVGTREPDEVFNAIINKSVSRKHLTIDVQATTSGQGGEVYTRSKIVVTDDSKIGTILDGEKLVKDSKILTNKEHTVKLGNWDQTLKLTWRPIVFTFTHQEKELRRNPAILEGIRDQLEPLDIKTIHPYVIDSTTHVVASKRNLPKVLQALVNGRHVVTDGFIEAIVKTTVSPGATEEKGRLPSRLEEDVHGAWPVALNYLPPAGREPNPRPAADFEPNADRVNVFEGFTFIFGYESQFESLSPILTNGGAKTLHYPLIEDSTSIDEFHKYVCNAAGKEDLGAVYDPDKSTAVIVVRPPGGDEKLSNWTKDMFRQIDIRLEQRSVWQNEFLEAILTVDARPLKRPLDEETQATRPPASTAPEPSTRAPAPAVQAMDVDQPRSGAEERSQETSQASPSKPKGRIKRILTKSKFKGLLDSDDEDEVLTPAKPAFEPVQEDVLVEDSNHARRNSVMSADSQSLFVSNSQPQSQPQRQNVAPNTANGSSKKRPIAEVDMTGEGDESMLDALLPGAAAMKKRRIEEAARAASQTPAPSRQPTPQALDKKALAKKTKEKLADVQRTTREHAERLDAQRRAATRTHTQDVDDRPPLELADMKSLAIVEEMEVLPRRFRQSQSQLQSQPARHTNGDSQTDNPRWDSRWNGLKNFKKFRRKGDTSGDASNRPPKVLVQLEEVKRKDFGIGESYWLAESKSKGGSRKSKSQTTQSQSQSQSQVRVRTRAEEEEDMEMDIDPVEVAGTARDSSIRAAAEEQTNGHRASGAASKKRPPAAGSQSTASAPPAKRQKQTRMQIARDEDDDSSDEDELKFRFSKKR